MLCSPIDECRVLRGISQSTAFVGTAPGLGFLTILLLLLFLVTGLPCAVIVDAAGGGGRDGVPVNAGLSGLPGPSLS